MENYLEKEQWKAGKINLRSIMVIYSLKFLELSVLISLVRSQLNRLEKLLQNLGN